jgi:hypothetical protein
MTSMRQLTQFVRVREVEMARGLHSRTSCLVGVAISWALVGVELEGTGFRGTYLGENG